MLDGHVEDGHFNARSQQLRLPVAGMDNGSARVHVRPHDLAVVAPGEGYAARVIAVHRLAERITLELQVDGQARPVELDLVATPDVSVPATGSVIGVQLLRWKAYSHSP